MRRQALAPIPAAAHVALDLGAAAGNTTLQLARHEGAADELEAAGTAEARRALAKQVERGGALEALGRGDDGGEEVVAGAIDARRDGLDVLDGLEE